MATTCNSCFWLVDFLKILGHVLTDRDEMSNLYKGPSTKFQFIWPSGFKGEDFLEIDQSETRIALVW
jgi:hypothetical protein